MPQRCPVVHVTPHYPPFLGGLENVVEALAAQRSRHGLPVTVLTSRAGLPRCGMPGYVRGLRSWQVAHTAIPPGLPGRLLRLPRDSVIHLHVSQAFLPESVLAAHLLRGLPYLAHLHLDAGPSGRAGFLLRGYQPLVLGPALRHAASVVVFTREQRAAAVAKYRLDPARVAVVPNGVGAGFWFSGRRQPGPRPRLLFAGRLSPQKNIPLLLQALAGVSARFETVLAGDGELGPALRRTTAALGLRNVRFCGRADGPGLRALYQQADVFVLPSEREGMPLVLLEALAMGLPVVATDIPGVRDLVADGRNGFLVPPGDPAAMRAALLRVTADPDRYQRMSAESRRVAGQYSWDRIGAEFERLYAEAGARAAGGGGGRRGRAGRRGVQR